MPILLLFLTVGAFPYRLTTRVTTLKTANFVMGFGLESGGTFRIGLSTNKPGNTLVILANQKEKELLKSKKVKLNEMCTINSTLPVMLNQLMHIGKNITYWSDSVEEKDVYSIFLVSCHGLTSYDLDIIMNNPNSRSDSRNKSLNALYKALIVVYSMIFFYWVFRASSKKILYVPLNFVFFLSPALKVSLLILNTIDIKAHEMNDTGNNYVSIALHCTELLYYGSMLSIILFTSAGCNIFRSKYNLLEHVQIIVASLLMVFGVIYMPLAKHEAVLMLSFCITCLAFLTYIYLGIVNLVITDRVLKKISHFPALHSRVKSSRQFVVQNYAIMLLSVIGEGVLFNLEVYLPAGMCFLEICFLIMTCIQARFFIGSEKNPESYIKNRSQRLAINGKAVLITDPRGTRMSILTQ